MTLDEIIRMAREAGFPFTKYGTLECDEDGEIDADEMFERFAALVAAAEREACIALHGHGDVQAPIGNSAWGDARQDGWIEGTSAYRNAIRARGEKGQS
jgi:hypothetical protein